MTTEPSSIAHSVDEAGALQISGVTRLEERDLVDALRSSPTNRRMRRTFVGLGILGGALLALALVVGVEVSSLWLVAGVLLLLGGVAMWRAFWIGGATTWRAMAEWERQLRFELREHRLRIRSEKTSYEVEWELLSSWWETPTAFAVELLQTNRSFVVFAVPKHAFRGEQEVDAVRSMLRARVRLGRAPTRQPGRSRLAKTLILWVLLIAMFVVIYQFVRPSR